MQGFVMTYLYVGVTPDIVDELIDPADVVYTTRACKSILCEDDDDDDAEAGEHGCQIRELLMLDMQTEVW